MQWLDVKTIVFNHGLINVASLLIMSVVLFFALVLLIIRRLLRELQTQRATLQHSEEKFAKAFHASPDAILISRMSDGQLIEVKEGFLRLSGYSREEAFAHPSLVLDLWANQQDQETWRAVLREHQSIHEHEYDFRTRSGDIVHGLYTGELIRLDAEDCVLSIVRDITARKRTENILTFLAQCASDPAGKFLSGPGALPGRKSKRGLCLY